MIKHKNEYRSLFIFRRDLRIADNTGFNEALKQSDVVIPCFIFDPVQIDPAKNKFYSANAVQFMINSLIGLDKELHRRGGRLYRFHGHSLDLIQELIISLSLNAVLINRDYTPFSMKRDKAIEAICKKNGVDFYAYHDALLHAPDEILKKDGTCYKKFTPFYQSASVLSVVKPHTFSGGALYTEKILQEQPESIYDTLCEQYNKNIVVGGGKKEALELCNQLKLLHNYEHTHDIININTSHFSAHNKFGTLSIRELYYAIIKHLGNESPLLRQLYWRDFFTYIAYHNPHVFGHAFNKQYDDISWNTDKHLFDAWCQGKTGFPIVDAGMRELNSTGFMHNRVRMIVASFLVKDLHVSWLWGERYFAQHLVDYDPAVNNGNWQWCASTGCDAQPYFRIFNPWLQQKRFDPACEYIKKWVVELKNYEPSVIHTLFKPNAFVIKNYPRPIVDHSAAVKVAKRMYRS